MVLDGKRTESQNLVFWTEKRNPQFWTEFGRKMGKWTIDCRNKSPNSFTFIGFIILFCSSFEKTDS